MGGKHIALIVHSVVNVIKQEKRMNKLETSFIQYQIKWQLREAKKHLEYVVAWIGGALDMIEEVEKRERGGKDTTG